MSKKQTNADHHAASPYATQSPGGELKLFRRWMGWSQQDFADWLLVSVSTVEGWEAERRYPPVAVTYLVRLAMRNGIRKLGSPTQEHEVLRPLK